MGFPEYLCPSCLREIVDARGRRLTFSNEGLGGGFVAHVDTGETAEEHVCFVRGRRYWADEHRFGGVVVIPFDLRERPAR